jgi:two-component sensor histidine kinase
MRRASPSRDPCTIRVRTTKENGSYLHCVYDSGVGIPSGFDPLTAKSLGLKLVNFPAKHQMRVKIEVKKENSTEKYTGVNTFILLSSDIIRHSIELC